MSSVQSQIQQDWNNREFVEVIASSIKKIAEFLNAFDLSARSRLALLNQKLTHLERQVEYIEARVTKWTVLHFRLSKNVPWVIYTRCWACYIDYMKAFYSMYTICCSDSVAQYCMIMPRMMNTSLILSSYCIYMAVNDVHVTVISSYVGWREEPCGVHVYTIWHEIFWGKKKNSHQTNF